MSVTVNAFEVVKPLAGERCDLSVIVASFVAVEADLSKLTSGIIRRINKKLSPSPMSIGADSMKDVIATPSASLPFSCSYSLLAYVLLADVVARGNGLTPRSSHAVRSRLPTYQIFCS